MKGETIIPFVYDGVGDFSSGLARVQKENKWGFIDATGKTIIKFQYKNANDFAEGLAPVMTENNLWGYIDATGKFILSPEYLQALQFRNGEAIVKSGDKFIFINRNGEKLREMKNAEAEENGMRRPQQFMLNKLS